MGDERTYDYTLAVRAVTTGDLDVYKRQEREALTYLRNVFSAYLITGPFSILVGFDGGLMALNDRLKLRSMVAAEKGNRVYFASEESAIRILEPELDRIWAPRGGEPVIVTPVSYTHLDVYKRQAERLAKHGANRLREKKKKSNLMRFFDQFKDVMILILIAAAVVSFVIACYEGNPCLLYTSRCV